MKTWRQRGNSLLKWLGTQFLSRYRQESLAVRTNLHILLTVLLLASLAVVLTGPVVLVTNRHPGIQVIVVALMLFFPILLGLLRRGRRGWVVALFTVVVSLLATVPYVIDAGMAYDPLKIDRICVQILIQLILISAITERAAYLLLGFVLMTVVLNVQVFAVLWPGAGTAASFLVSLYIRDLVNLSLATGVLAILQRSFHRAICQVEAANLTLEARVQERTEQLQQAQRSLVEGERLAVLGRLSASVAHEVNTPLGAIQSSIQTIQAALPGFLDRAVSLFPRLSPGQEPLLTDLLNHRSGTPTSHGLESRRLQKEMSAELSSWGVVDAEDLAGQLVDAGIPTLSARWAPLLSSPVGSEAVRLLSDYASVLKSGLIVETATQKAAHYIVVLRQYYDQNTQLPLVPMDLSENLEEVLTLLRNRMGPGIRVEKRLVPGLVVVAQPGRIRQVWDNLISNALQAMGSEGTLTLGVEVDEASVVVTIGDTGPGIPGEIREKLFDSFLSTKPLGGSVGIGLGIARAIVAEHEGRLTFDSVPGNTRFHVRLPRGT